MVCEHGLEGDSFEAFEWGRAALDLHTENRALPGREEELGEVGWIEGCVDFSDGLSFGDAGCKRRAPFVEDCLKAIAEELALRGSLEAEVADQAAAIPVLVGEHVADDVEIAEKPLAGCEGIVFQGLPDVRLGVGEIAVEDLLGERFLGAEVVGKGAMGSSGGGADIAYGGSLVSGLKHDFEAGFEDVFAE